MIEMTCRPILSSNEKISQSEESRFLKEWRFPVLRQEWKGQRLWSEQD